MKADPAKSTPGDTGTSLWQETATHVVDLLTHYSFDLGGKSAGQLLDRWESKYATNWVRWAVIEALYQGRYKAVSVEQILQLWQRRQQPRCHFNYEFERLVCNKFPRDLSQSPRSQRAVQASTPPPDIAALPPIPAPPSRSTNSSPSDLPAWAALAAQIQQTEATSSGGVQNPPIAPLNLDQLEAPDILLDRVARLQAGVEALIEQATSSLNASTEAMKTKLQPGEADRANGTSKAIQPPPDLLEDVHPPIDQFMPPSVPSEFHSKLKAVAEKDAIE